MINKFYCTIFLTILVSGYVSVQKSNSNFHLYLIMGQSNMAGRGEITEEYKNESHDRVFMLDKNNNWVLAKHPLHFDKPAIAGVSLGLAFGINMADAEPAIKIGLIPCAVGGTSIYHWEPGAYDVNTQTYPYDDAVIRLKEAMKSGVIKGVLWHQGEAERTPERASKYLSKLSVIIENIRKEAKDNELPFIAGEIPRYLPRSENVNRELAKLPEQVQYTAIATSEGLVPKGKGDNTHFDSPSLTKLGQRYAKKMKEVQSQ